MIAFKVRISDCDRQFIHAKSAAMNHFRNPWIRWWRARSTCFLFTFAIASHFSRIFHFSLRCIIGCDQRTHWTADLFVISPFFSILQMIRLLTQVAISRFAWSASDVRAQNEENSRERMLRDRVNDRREIAQRKVANVIHKCVTKAERIEKEYCAVTALTVVWW